MNKPSIGTISHGTLRPADLMHSFADELRLYSPDHDRVKEADAVQTLWAAGWNDIFDSKQVSGLVYDLHDTLNAIAPPYCYFGIVEGDVSDFGFWPDMHQIEDLPRISDPNEAPTGEDCLFVNDHGNITVYSADGAILLEAV